MKKFSLILMSLVFVLTACEDPGGLFDSENPKKVPLVPEDKSEAISDVGEISKESFKPALDILFVIDNSGSMQTHQENLARNIRYFTDAITQNKLLDYHIGVVNSSGPTTYNYGSYGMPPQTGECCGRLLAKGASPNFIERNTVDGVELLANNLLVGTNSGSNEMFFGPIVWALSPANLANLANFNQGFLRDDAYLAIIVITDTDDQTENMDAIGTYNFLKNLKGSADKIFVGAAFIPDAEVLTCTGESGEIQGTDNLPQFFQMTAAMTFSLCEQNFGTKLAEIGKVLANKAQTMLLKKIPKRGSITVTMDGVSLPNDVKRGWSYNPSLNALEFGRDIDWDQYGEGTYPVVNFESLPIVDKK